MTIERSNQSPAWGWKKAVIKVSTNFVYEN